PHGLVLRLQGVPAGGAGEAADHGGRLGHAVATVGAGGPAKLTREGDRRAAALPRSQPGVRRRDERPGAAAGVLPRRARIRRARRVAGECQRAVTLSGAVLMPPPRRFRTPTGNGEVLAVPDFA